MYSGHYNAFHCRYIAQTQKTSSATNRYELHSWTGNSGNVSQEIFDVRFILRAQTYYLKTKRAQNLSHFEPCT